MARLIDADAKIEQLKKNFCENCERRKCGKRKKYPIFGVACVTCWVMDAAEEMDNAPTIEAEPVRHGRWREISAHKDYDGDILRDYECTECLGIIRDVPDCWQSENFSLDRYCSMCGAKMDGGAENG